MTAAPLILTLRFDAASFDFFDGARRRHFPPERNHISAHLTLFHHLPADRESALATTLREATRDTSPMVLRVAGLRFLGYGCAYAIESEALHALRRELAVSFDAFLTPPDRNAFKPHVTIQNKVASAEAKRVFAELQADFTPFEASATGLLLWRYLGGPWEKAGAFPFAVDG